MKVLVLNSGSSSIKYQLFNMDEKTVLAKGVIEKIGFEDSIASYKNGQGKKIKTTQNIKNHLDGIKIILETLVNSEYGVIMSTSEIDAVGHRITQGGTLFNESTIINEEVKEAIQKCFPLAPLHNPPQYKGLLAIEEVMPNVTNVAAFDTSFHKSIPDYAYIYGLPYEWYKKYEIRKYGFHGLSHYFVAKRAGEMLGKDWKELKIISCHLGNGASISAINKGVCIDNSMGFTPLEGLVMGTRCGDIDPGIIPYIMEKENLSIKEIDTILNKESGLKGISGISSDSRDLEQAIKDGSERALLALRIFDYRVKKYIGAYMAALNGCDVLVFTGGLGENASDMRQYVCKNMDYLGIKIDLEENNVRATEKIISTPDSKVKVLIVLTDEELVIAEETQRLMGK